MQHFGLTKRISKAGGQAGGTNIFAGQQAGLDADNEGVSTLQCRETKACTCLRADTGVESEVGHGQPVFAFNHSRIDGKGGGGAADHADDVAVFGAHLLDP